MSSRVESAGNARSRKRQKISHDPVTAAELSRNTRPNRVTMPEPVDIAEPAKIVTTDNTACTHKKELVALGDDLDTMRQLITCRICQRLLTEPYGLACGHTYCYICLDTWLVVQKKATCPECRAMVTSQPVPSYIIKELVHLFSTKTSLLSTDGETIEELAFAAQEAADRVLRDKDDNGELFGGTFTGTRRPSRRGGEGMEEALYDPEDNVYRCPMCYHEIEDGMCSGCGEPMAGMGPWNDDEDDLDGDLDLEDEFEQTFRDSFGHALSAGSLRSRRHHAPRRHQYGSGSIPSDDSSDDDSDSEMDSFINDDVDEEQEEEEENDVHGEGTDMLGFASDPYDLAPADSDSSPLREPVREMTSRSTRALARANRPIVIDSDDEEGAVSSGVEITSPAAVTRTSGRRHRHTQTGGTARSHGRSVVIDDDSGDAQSYAHAESTASHATSDSSVSHHTGSDEHTGYGIHGEDDSKDDDSESSSDYTTFNTMHAHDPLSSEGDQGDSELDEMYLQNGIYGNYYSDDGSDTA